eukprot:jgi/Bigna1/69864/fgenesh1_pg.10_\
MERKVSRAGPGATLKPPPKRKLKDLLLSPLQSKKKQKLDSPKTPSDSVHPKPKKRTLKFGAESANCPSYKNGLDVKISNLERAGCGLFATRGIKKGHVVAKIVGTTITKDVFDLRKNANSDGYCFWLTGLLYIDCFESTPRNLNRLLPGDHVGGYVNDFSCAPALCNCNVKLSENETHLVLVANRYIKKGEEVYFDYTRRKKCPAPFLSNPVSVERNSFTPFMTEIITKNATNLQTVYDLESINELRNQWDVTNSLFPITVGEDDEEVNDWFAEMGILNTTTPGFMDVSDDSKSLPLIPHCEDAYYTTNTSVFQGEQQMQKFPGDYMVRNMKSNLAVRWNGICECSNHMGLSIMLDNEGKMGLYASRDLQYGDIITKFFGVELSWRTAMEMKRQNHHKHIISGGNNSFIDASLMFQNPSRLPIGTAVGCFIVDGNESVKMKNCRTRHAIRLNPITNKMFKSVIFVATRNIRNGEELVADYNGMRLV